MLAQPPDISLVASQTGTVDTALLSCTNTDSLSVLHVAYRVTLCVLQGDEGDNQVALSLWRECLVLGRHILEKCIVVELDLVTSLLEGDAEYLLTLNRLRHIGRINLDDVVGALTLVLQDLDSLWGEVGCYHTIAYLALQQLGCCSVAGIRECHKVTIARHAVCATGTCISTGNRTLVESLYIIHEVDLLECIAQGQTNGGTCRTHVLE